MFTTVVFSGLVAGLLYGYACSVNIGLKSLPDREYIKAMQSINAGIQNPGFFLSFAGLLLLFPATALSLYRLHLPLFSLFIAAMAVYFIGVFGVTMFGNVPLNERLASFSTFTATGYDTEAARQRFEKPWLLFHNSRTIAAVISFGLTVLFILKQKT